MTRARALLLAADGVATTAIAQAVGASPASVTAWRERFAAEGLKGFAEVREGRGRKPSVPPEKVAAIVHATLHDRPAGETHWSCRTMARAQGVSPATVQRIWSARGLKPHLVKTFKLSSDKRFEEKLTDVVGLYLNPPDQAVVLCMDEKSSIQALDRTQPTLPMKKGRAGTMTHDYKRNGTTPLFAALDVLTGTVIGQCLPRHRHAEFLKFLRLIDRQVPPGATAAQFGTRCLWGRLGSRIVLSQVRGVNSRGLPPFHCSDILGSSGPDGGPRPPVQQTDELLLLALG